MQEALDGLEFARGDATSKWGSVRAAMGHPEPFDLRYVAVGNEDCGKTNYRGMYTFLVNPFLCMPLLNFVDMLDFCMRYKNMIYPSTHILN